MANLLNLKNVAKRVVRPSASSIFEKLPMVFKKDLAKKYD
jgi:hypothetical protein